MGDVSDRLMTYSMFSRNYSGLLVACGDSLSLVVSAGIAASGGNARTHHQTPANCCRVPIYRARAVRSLREKRPEELRSVIAYENLAPTPGLLLRKRTYHGTSNNRYPCLEDTIEP